MKKLNWTITVERFPDPPVPEEEATEEQLAQYEQDLEQYEKDLDKRVGEVRQILRQLEAVHLISRRSIRSDKRMPKDALFRLRLGKNMYFTGYNFERGGGKLVISSAIEPFRSHALACSLFSFLKARGKAKKLRHPKFSTSQYRESVQEDLIWQIVNHDKRATPLYGPSPGMPAPRIISILHNDLSELKGHINSPTATRRGLLRLGAHIEISPLSLEKGNGIQIHYRRSRSKGTHVTDPPAEILPLVLYSFWSGESAKPNCSLSFSNLEPFAR